MSNFTVSEVKILKELINNVKPAVSKHRCAVKRTPGSIPVTCYNGPQCTYNARRICWFQHFEHTKIGHVVHDPYRASTLAASAPAEHVPGDPESESSKHVNESAVRYVEKVVEIPVDRIVERTVEIPVQVPSL